MPTRRVIVHAGFHKTATTTTQTFLRENGKHIWPRCALVLPGRLRAGAARMAVRYARLGNVALLNAFASDLKIMLGALDVGENRNLLISDENLAGRMPGRDNQRDYAATPLLMARAEAVIHDVFGTDTEVVFHFTTRASDDWLWSTYKHNLRTSRLPLDWATYRKKIEPASDLEQVALTVAKQVKGRVQTADLAGLTGRYGPAGPLVDLMELPDHLRNNLVPVRAQNTGADDTLIPELLSLNQSTMTDADVMAAKANLLGKARI